MQRLLALMALAVAGCGGSSGASIGAVMGRDNESRALYVREAPQGMGAEKAGLQPGDEIVMIEGRYVKDMDATAVRAKLRGDPGSAVQLTVVRGNEVLHVRVVRAALGARRPSPPPREERITE